MLVTTNTHLLCGTPRNGAGLYRLLGLTIGGCGGSR